ncbi:hypothetical protein R8Z50_21410 [Longispora sp. K20-0274]|uniref:hypothetical protein n=1 Tax=Longispora sp. K20-0274 TaxID=3088255 RepID=UPI00399A32AD
MSTITTIPAPRPTVSAVPRWADRAARAAALTAVPSGLWRLAMGTGLSMGFTGPSLDRMQALTPGWGTAYLVMLSLFAESLAFLTMGLVRPWGERMPRWVPVLGGRRIPRLAAIIPATLGGIAVTYVTTWGALHWAGNVADSDAPKGAWAALMTVCYAPLLAWGPLLLAVTAAFAVRTARRGR